MGKCGKMWKHVYFWQHVRYLLHKVRIKNKLWQHVLYLWPFSVQNVPLVLTLSGKPAISVSLGSGSVPFAGESWLSHGFRGFPVFLKAYYRKSYLQRFHHRFICLKEAHIDSFKTTPPSPVEHPSGQTCFNTSSLLF